MRPFTWASISRSARRPPASVRGSSATASCWPTTPTSASPAMRHSCRRPRRCSALRRADVVAAARTARDCGASRLVLVSPLPALLQLNAASHTLSSASEVEIARDGLRVAARDPADRRYRRRGRGGRLVPGCRPHLHPHGGRDHAAAARAGAARAHGRGRDPHGGGSRDAWNPRPRRRRSSPSIVEETMPGALPRKVRLR